MPDNTLREELLALLGGDQAHLPLNQVLKGLPAKLRHDRPAPDVHTIWEELEHMRIAQRDILQYVLDPAWESPEWPEGYWPESKETLSTAAWTWLGRACCSACDSDRRTQ